jgi:hypothetical protein
VHFHDQGEPSEARDWCDITDEIVVELFEERRVCRRLQIGHKSHKKRVSVGRRAHDSLSADVVATARPVLNDELLAESFRQPLPEAARRACKWMRSRMRLSPQIILA